MKNEGRIRFVQAGFLGSTHDAVSFQLLEPIGPGYNLDFLPNAKLLAPVVQTLDSAIHWINHYPVDK